MQEVAIVLGRCNGKLLFGIRFVCEVDGLWVGRWAFDVLEQEAKREQWDDSSIDGTFSFVSQGAPRRIPFLHRLSRIESSPLASKP